MNDFLPIFCPICNLRLRISGAHEEGNLLVCSTEGINCSFIYYDEDWNFTSLEFYISHVFTVIEPNLISVFLSNSHPVRISTKFSFHNLININENMIKSLDRIKTAIIFA